MITTYDEACRALANAEDDVRADFGEEMLDSAYSDVVKSVAQMCTPEVGNELCRTKLGWSVEEEPELFR